MAKPRKAEVDKRVKCSVYATQAEWASINAAARNAGLTMPRYLVGLHEPQAELVPPTAKPVRRNANGILALARLQAGIDALAVELVGQKGAALLLSHLAGIEAALIALRQEV